MLTRRVIPLDPKEPHHRRSVGEAFPSGPFLCGTMPLEQGIVYQILIRQDPVKILLGQLSMNHSTIKIGRTFGRIT